MATMYARREPNGTYTMRQERYRSYLADGSEHPHDVCAVARGVTELHEMCDKYWPDADYSAVASPACPHGLGFHCKECWP